MLNIINEEWRPIQEFDGRYEVSNLGRIRSKNYNRMNMILSQKVHYKTGYLQCSFSIYDTKLQKVRQIHKDVHRLVAKAFLPNPQNKPQINHINFDKTDNKVTNLEWCTCKENIQHSYRAGHYNDVNHYSWLNKKVSNKSKYRYVYWDTHRQKWKASIKNNQKTYNIGRFDTEEEAAKAADNFIIKMNWSNRVLNFN